MSVPSLDGLLYSYFVNGSGLELMCKEPTSAQPNLTACNQFWSECDHNVLSLVAATEVLHRKGHMFVSVPLRPVRGCLEKPLFLTAPGRCRDQESESSPCCSSV
jgi:hypothetical protein